MGLAQSIDKDGQDFMPQASVRGKTALIDPGDLQFRKQIAWFVGLQFAQAGKVIDMLTGFKKAGVRQGDAVSLGFIGQDGGMSFR